MKSFKVIKCKSMLIYTVSLYSVVLRKINLTRGAHLAVHGERSLRDDKSMNVFLAARINELREINLSRKLQPYVSRGRCQRVSIDL